MSPPAAGETPRIVCKVGGSLLDGGWAPGIVEVLRRASPGLGVLAVSGGGRAADRIRARHRRGQLGLSEAHWAAIRVLDVTALRLAGGCGARLPVTTTLRLPARPGASDSGGHARRTPDPGPAGRLAVLAPSPLLRRHDPLPHGWDVTSDSIAAWAAVRCGASDLVLLKARGDPSPSPAGGPGNALSAPRAARRGWVDRHLPAVLADATCGAWIVNGRYPGRLLDFLTGDASAATALLT